MRLLLLRRYRPDVTRGVLSCRGKHWVWTVEMPHPDYAPPLACIPEGCYAIKGNYSEKWGWHLNIVGNNLPKPVSFRPLVHLNGQPNCHIMPVSFFGENGKAMFSRLANLKLTDRIYNILAEGEEVRLEIVGISVNLKRSLCFP